MFFMRGFNAKDRHGYFQYTDNIIANYAKNLKVQAPFLLNAILIKIDFASKLQSRTMFYIKLSHFIHFIQSLPDTQL